MEAAWRTPPPVQHPSTPQEYPSTPACPSFSRTRGFGELVHDSLFDASKVSQRLVISEEDIEKLASAARDLAPSDSVYRVSKSTVSRI